MSDNRRRYRTIRKELKRLYPFEPKGKLARHLNTLAGLISGIVGSNSTHLPKVAKKVPDNIKKKSRVKRFSRWVNNERIEFECYYLPFVEALVGLAHRLLLLAIDGSEMGRGCLTLLVSVIYKKRTLPIAWIAVRGSKGHFPEEAHPRLVEQVCDLVPEGCDVIFLGDGEFAGTTLQATVTAYGWEYVCRTAKNAHIDQEDYQFPLHEVEVQPGECLGLYDVFFTHQAYGPVLVIAWWKAEYKEPIYSCRIARSGRMAVDLAIHCESLWSTDSLCDRDSTVKRPKALGIAKGCRQGVQTC